MDFKKPEKKKTKFKKCSCGTITILWICPNCGKVLIDKNIKKDQRLVDNNK